MPGTPPVTPKLGIPRFDNADPADFSTDVNSIVDALDNAVTPLTDTGWLPLVLQTGVTAVPGEGPVPAARIHNKVIYLRGNLYVTVGGGGALITHFATLPAGVISLITEVLGPTEQIDFGACRLVVGGAFQISYVVLTDNAGTLFAQDAAAGPLPNPSYLYLGGLSAMYDE
jgi:hypothetical protein